VVNSVLLKYKNVHITPQDKFLKPFINFMDENFPIKEHLFVVIDYKNNYDAPNEKNVIKVSSLFMSRFKVDYGYSEKIILHGLFRHIPTFLFFNQSLIKKSYWIIWGHDLYMYRKANKSLHNWAYEFIRKIVIRKIENYIVYMDSEFELMRDVYQTKGRHFKSFVYPSNLYEERVIKNKTNKTVRFLIGNSASRTNNHLETFEKLKAYRGENIKLIVPLSYGGSHKHVEQVIEKGLRIFGDKFVPIRKYMDYQEYIDLLSTIDISIFNHDRQEAVGNTNLLISLGAKIYLRSETSQWKFYNDKNIKVFDINDFNMNKLSNSDMERNRNILKNLFSKEALKKQLKEIFDA
jgi:dTDP-N-acetylfucosamine:lipid II N-acetylfucosaminyltransferase